MAKWKETTTEVAVTGVDPRVRMKEIRAEVKAFLKGDTLGLAHLGDLPSNMEDGRRVIIATQDLLDIEREKHRKATLHICELVDILDGMSETQDELMSMMDQRDRQFHYLDNVIEGLERHITKIGVDAHQARAERDAVLTTMKLLNGQPTQADYNATRPLPIVEMGLSNKDCL